jgi:preprotein translocase subunit YajC
MYQTVFLQASGASPMPSLFIMVGMIIVMYFFMIRPQAKKAKEQKKFAESITTGEKVITTAGIHGTINRINEDGTIQLEVGRANFITIERSAVSMEMTAAYRKKTDAAVATTTK